MYLMNKDIEVAEFDFDKQALNVIRPELMPYGLRYNITLEDIKNWLCNRLIYVRYEKDYQCENILDFGYKSKGLSFNDCFWLNENNEKWNTVNLYDNINNDIYIQLQNSEDVNDLLKGRYKNYIKKTDNKLYFYKQEGKEHGLITSLCSDILNYIGVNAVKYNFIDNIISSECFTDTYKSSSNVINLMRDADLQGINKWLENQSLYYDMYVMDFILDIKDRNLGNISAYYDSESLDLIELCPLYNFSTGLYKDKTEDINTVLRRKRALLAKSKSSININKLKECVNIADIKHRFENIFGGLEEYTAILDRIKIYNEG